MMNSKNSSSMKVFPQASVEDMHESEETWSAAPKHGASVMRCVVIRERKGKKSASPEYKLCVHHQGKLKKILVATTRRSKVLEPPSFHIFNPVNEKYGPIQYNKTSPHYLGKVCYQRQGHFNSFVLYSSNPIPEEIGAIQFLRTNKYKNNRNYLYSSSSSSSSSSSDNHQQHQQQNQNHQQSSRVFRVIFPPLNKTTRKPIPNLLPHTKRTEDPYGSLNGELLFQLNKGFGSKNNQRFITTNCHHHHHHQDNENDLNKNGMTFIDQFPQKYRGRLQLIPSKKNFQIYQENYQEDEMDHENILCQFAKMDEDMYYLDYLWPMTPFQAFSVALAQFSV